MRMFRFPNVELGEVTYNSNGIEASFIVRTNNYCDGTPFPIGGSNPLNSLLLGCQKPTKVIFNNPATIVWFGNEKVVVKCSENDTYDPEKGLAMAVCKYVYGDGYMKIFRENVAEC